MSLTDKRLRFVEEYLLDLNGTQAALRAGYSPKTAYSIANELLGDEDVAAAIDAAMKDRSKRVGISQDYVVKSLVQIAERCQQAAPVMVRRGKEMVQKIDEEGRHVWSFDAKGANTALIALGKHLGMFVERVEQSGPNGAPQEVKVTHEIIDPGAAAPTE